MATQLSERVHTAEKALKVPQDLEGSRILVIMPSIPVQGMERANLQIMRMMRERGADILFVTERSYGSRIQREVESIGCRWTTASLTTKFEERLHLTKNPVEMAGVLRAWVRAAWQIDRIYRQYKPTHIHVTNSSFALYALPTLWRTRRCVILRLPNISATPRPRVKQVLSTWIWRYCIVPACNIIVCNSHHTEDRLGELRAGLEKSRVIYNCLPERAGPALSDVPEINPDHFNIAYLGRIRPEKGVRELLDVALRIVEERDDVDFYLAGENHWKNPFAEALIREVQVGGMAKRIRFIGEIEDIFGLLAQCNLHVCPSMSEAFGLVVLEAKSQGIPSVVFPSGGLKEVVVHLVDGYICREKTAHALYEGIRYFIDDSKALQTMGRSAKSSLERFSRQQVADEWARLFKTRLKEEELRAA